MSLQILHRLAGGGFFLVLLVLDFVEHPFVVVLKVFSVKGFWEVPILFGA